MKWKLLFWFLDFLSSRVFLAVFWSQRQQARDEIAVVSVLKDWFFVTAACGENAHLCQIQINKCIITVAAGIQMRLCSVSVVWKQKNPWEFLKCWRVAVRKMFHGRSLFRKGAMPHLKLWCKTCSEGRIHPLAPWGTFSNIPLALNLVWFVWERTGRISNRILVQLHLTRSPESSWTLLECRDCFSLHLFGDILDQQGPGVCVLL